MNKTLDQLITEGWTVESTVGNVAVVSKRNARLWHHLLFGFGMLVSLAAGLLPFVLLIGVLWIGISRARTRMTVEVPVAGTTVIYAAPEAKAKPGR